MTDDRGAEAQYNNSGLLEERERAQLEAWLVQFEGKEWRREARGCNDIYKVDADSIYALETHYYHGSRSRVRRYPRAGWPRVVRALTTRGSQEEDRGL
jgi:hypothetical protein